MGLLSLDSWWKIAHNRLLAWAIQHSWSRGDFYSGAYVPCGPHLACWVSMMAYRACFWTLDTWHKYTSLTSSSVGELIHHFEFMTLLLFIDPMGELLIVHDIIIIFMIISHYIIVLWLGEGNFVHVGPLPIITHLTLVLCHVMSCERGQHVPFKRIDH